jgi:hypothetical protein
MHGIIHDFIVYHATLVDLIYNQPNTLVMQISNETIAPCKNQIQSREII